MRIAIVYVGNPTPRYVWRNLENLRNLFPKYEVLLISDQESDVARAKKKGIQAWKASDVSKSWNDVREQMVHPMDFRNGFWFSTSARFLAISEYMQNFPNQGLLQIEGDVWTAPSFPMDKISTLKSEFAFPLEAPGIGVASSLYIRNSAAAKFLADFAARYLIENVASTDMKILGALADRFPEKCLIFPSAPPHPKPEAFRQPDARTAENFGLFNGIFDGVHWGAYMLGEDPRNHRGIRLLYNREFPWEVRPWEYELTSTDSGLPAVTFEGNVYPIFSLHVHVKIRKLFSTEQMSKTWKRRIVQAENGTRREIMLKVLVKQGFKAIVRRVKSLRSES